MTSDETFYLTCALMMVVGFLIFGLACLVGLWSETVGGYLILLAVCCVLMGPGMAMVGPS